jgi:hypothetical protein
MLLRCNSRLMVLGLHPFSLAMARMSQTCWRSDASVTRSSA